MADENNDMSETLGLLPDIADMSLDLTKDEKLRTAALMLGIRYHTDTIIRDPRYLELMIQKEEKAKYGNEPDKENWHLRPSTVDAVLRCAQEFEQFLLGNRPGMQVVQGGQEIVPENQRAQGHTETEE